jgi:hypothetical protein
MIRAPLLLPVVALLLACPLSGTVVNPTTGPDWPSDCPHPLGIERVIDMSGGVSLPDSDPRELPGFHGQESCVGIVLTDEKISTVAGATLRSDIEGAVAICTSKASFTAKARPLGWQLSGS